MLICPATIIRFSLIPRVIFVYSELFTEPPTSGDFSFSYDLIYLFTEHKNVINNTFYSLFHSRWRPPHSHTKSVLTTGDGVGNIIRWHSTTGKIELKKMNILI